MVFAEHLVVHRHERVNTRLVDDCPQFHIRRRWHFEREVCNLGDEQDLGRFAREAGREQSVGQIWRLVV